MTYLFFSLSSFQLVSHNNIIVIAGQTYASAFFELNETDLLSETLIENLVDVFACLSPSDWLSRALLDSE